MIEDIWQPRYRAVADQAIWERTTVTNRRYTINILFLESVALTTRPSLRPGSHRHQQILPLESLRLGSSVARLGLISLPIWQPRRAALRLNKRSKPRMLSQLALLARRLAVWRRYSLPDDALPHRGTSIHSIPVCLLLISVQWQRLCMRL